MSVFMVTDDFVVVTCLLPKGKDGYLTDFAYLQFLSLPDFGQLSSRLFEIITSVNMKFELITNENDVWIGRIILRRKLYALSGLILCL
ncbi:hypothetical protein QE152_g25523 [Popillia japonica]|uniref:Uncharacterized protein n=1 Tax=Popillia japonica TaxID=7064 RepID=A0AAW1K1A9_POPJA